jgi:tRNA1Val (adenine37-N6)-methyltransferase
MKVCTDSCLFGALIEINSQTKNILDIGTGTGLLSLMCAQKSNPNTFIDAIEIDADAYSQAKGNIENSIWKDRINIIHANFFEYSFGIKYDLIICNPPYYKKQKSTTDIKNRLARHNDDFDFCIFLEKCWAISNAHTQLYVIFPYYRTQEILKTIELDHKWECDTIIYIHNKIDSTPLRCVFILSLEMKKYMEKTEIAIYDENKNYTNIFKSLLCNYYTNIHIS